MCPELVEPLGWTETGIQEPEMAGTLAVVLETRETEMDCKEVLVTLSTEIAAYLNYEQDVFWWY